MKPCLINFRRTQCHYTKQRRIIAISKQQIANLRLPVNLRQMAALAGWFLAIFFSAAVGFFSLHLRQMINVTNALEKISLWNERPLLPFFRYGCQHSFSFCFPNPWFSVRTTWKLLQKDIFYVHSFLLTIYSVLSDVSISQRLELPCTCSHNFNLI